MLRLRHGALCRLIDGTASGWSWVARNVMSTSTFRPAERVRAAKPSIWVEFTTLAAECNAVNLGQGFPDEPMPMFMSEILREVAAHPEKTAWHQYTRVEFLSGTYLTGSTLCGLYGRQINANDEILVTVGAYLALYYAFMGLINHGDEVLIIDPAYDSYAPQVLMAGGVPVHCALSVSDQAKTSNDFRFDIGQMRAKCNNKAKMIVLNNPNNPTGKLFTRGELEDIAQLARDFNLIVVADEVYEWHVWNKEMIRFASLPGMYERTISIGSAGKAFSVTGWKLGWCIAPKHLMTPMRMMHQNCVFTCSTPTQEAVATAFEKELELIATNRSQSYLLTGLPNELRTKCERMYKMLHEGGFDPIMPDAGYFMIARFGKIDGPFKVADSTGDPLDFRFVRWLCREKKLATIPPSAFYSEENKSSNADMIRLCLMKADATMEAAHKILKSL
ncbi:hypothetical protein KIN20_032209 [Parelaphostrongylus tenuis]|uniref:Aminotransferase class I/classII large domain-containing protein n=1 Tax=Parelaphostrongylus tenuis TaxID=148309 RepID=A0AAD5R6X2_PARTN|nr:hypothetical protein KIN20_032209 [Parelaphostrongylus tenuis]